MSKQTSTWYSERVGQDVTVSRWGEVGRPLLVFPTAGGDAEEGERFHLIDAISDSLADCKVKAYAVDSIAGQAWTRRGATLHEAARMQNCFDELVVQEVVPAIRADCGVAVGEPLEIAVAGASIGAFNALSTLCRHPDLFSVAICMSGTYDLRKFVPGPPIPEYVAASPLHFVPEIDENSQHLARLRERFVLLAHGEGKWESPDESWRVADVLGSRGIPNRVDAWGSEWDHDWVTWREMLPRYLSELMG